MRSSEPFSGLVLASASPRRQEMFARIFGEQGFRVAVPDFDESSIPVSGNAREYVRAVSQAKCRALLQEQPDGNYLAVAADTIVTCGGGILGKPAGVDGAADMLRKLSGRQHSVLTAISMAYSRHGEILTEIETTQVWFARLDEQTIRWYVATGEPMDKAGAYGIQDLGAVLVSRIKGCYNNVVGLPVRRMIDMIERIGKDPGAPFVISNHLPWRHAETAGGRHGIKNHPDEGHPQDPAAL